MRGIRIVTVETAWLLANMFFIFAHLKNYFCLGIAINSRLQNIYKKGYY